ncbi:MAG: diguanylate cyclase [Burkholderiales bacterium]|nr:diguanylate cyclase [Burkholderiales bacterium]
MSHSARSGDRGWFKQLFELSPDPAWIVDHDRFVECNDAAARTLGYASCDDFLNVHPAQLSPQSQPDGEDSYVKAERMMALAREKGLHRFEWTYTKANGMNFVAEVTLSTIEIRERQVLYCVWRDITERRRWENALSVAARRWQTTFDATRDAICVLDTHQVILECNRATGAHTGASPESMIGRHCWEVLHGTTGPIPECPMIRMRTSLRREQIELQLGERWLEETVDPIMGERQALLGAVHSLRDITERKQMEAQIRQLAFHDTLTNLPNRRLLNDRLGQTMAACKRSGGHGAMMFLDLDNFKLLNDTHGHEVGDSLLIAAADRLKSCVREIDTVARFGGDEFVVMLSDLNADRSESTAQAGVIAEKIRAALARPYVLQVRREGEAETTVEHQCTASIGVAMFGKHDTSAEDILKWADRAMYRAKDAGLNSIRFFDPETRD